MAENESVAKDEHDPLGTTMEYLEYVIRQETGYSTHEKLHACDLILNYFNHLSCE
jgi:hypothetical protein